MAMKTPLCMKISSFPGCFSLSFPVHPMLAQVPIPCTPLSQLETVQGMARAYTGKTVAYRGDSGIQGVKRANRGRQRIYTGADRELQGVQRMYRDCLQGLTMGAQVLSGKIQGSRDFIRTGVFRASSVFPMLQKTKL